MSRDIVDKPASQLFFVLGAGFLVIWGLGVGLLFSSRAFGSRGLCRCSAR